MKVEDQIRKTWDQYYQENSGDTVLKDRNFFVLETGAILQAIESYIERHAGKELVIVELGSGLGGLAEKVELQLAAKTNLKFRYFGYDFSGPGVEKSNARGLKHSHFIEKDFIAGLRSLSESPDIIITQRAVMALMEAKDQEDLMILIRETLKLGGEAILSEGSQQGLQQLIDLRSILNIQEGFEKVWHSLYLDEAMLQRVFGTKLETNDYSSMYWLITRVVYPFFETPKHNSKIHDFAAKLAPSGNFGLVKLFLYRK